METELTIQEVAKQTGLSIDTLRYYERIGLLDPVRRDQSGYRRYSQQDLDWIGLLMDLRAIGMPRAQMVRLAHLFRQGFAATLSQRRRLLEEYQHTLQLQVQEMEQHIQGLQNTITMLKELETMLIKTSSPTKAGAGSSTANGEGSDEDPSQTKQKMRNE
jgi:DNA-binding transcriptional MerR regulator